MKSKSRSQWPRYSAYGIALASDFAFTTHLPPTQATPDLAFTIQRRPPLPPAAPVIHYASRLKDASGQPVATLSRQDGVEILRYGDWLEFYFWPDRIVGRLLDSSRQEFLEARVLGGALCYWLERRLVPTLHASAVAFEGAAVAFAGASRSGKTTLAAALAQRGLPLLTDDILPLRQAAGAFWAQPGIPQLNLWPDQADYFLGHGEKLPVVPAETVKGFVVAGRGGLGSFCPEPRPLRALFLPQRSEAATGIVIGRLEPAEALFALLQRGYFPGILQMLPNPSERVDLLARLVSRTPVYRLRYPAGYEHLPGVAGAVLDRLRE